MLLWSASILQQRASGSLHPFSPPFILYKVEVVFRKRKTKKNLLIAPDHECEVDFDTALPLLGGRAIFLLWRLTLIPEWRIILRRLLPRMRRNWNRKPTPALFVFARSNTHYMLKIRLRRMGAIRQPHYR